MMLLRPQTPSQSFDQSPLHHGRKRKADSQPESNERLSKRLSLLNLEHNGHKLYVPVENAQRTDASSSTYTSTPHYSPPRAPQPSSSLDDEPMHIDDTKHKVYIYNIDDELSSESEPESSDEQQRRVVFLPDLEKHLRANRIGRIPPQLLMGDPEIHDAAAKQLVLYQVPSSITVPEEQDSVRKAIIEARARVRERQTAEREAANLRRRQGLIEGPAMPNGMFTDAPMDDEVREEDSDAMELD
ncbi:hypothetical protein CONLIGDRAFT_657539 [Coniochaeta ligniaria NRRL 30616]|uniref:Uncharacterized protein n=1 Tax=Coniochaeta ligniaria NRRL 30616 TaxID=1408157 RepID=A0A1J7I9J6_9PEZI|nr:hypothetical protein CONLIGDRAFT_657539 [Coniochaeta ligniaria NRRL 30616]